MTEAIATESQPAEASALVATPAGLEVYLGLGADGLALDVAPGAVPPDLDPWLLDLCAVQVGELGHWDRVPRSHDWEHLLPLLQPGEELLWIVDYLRDAARPFTLRLALKSNAVGPSTPTSLRMRQERFRALISGFRRQAFPESALSTLSPDEAWALVSGEAHGETWCVTGIPSPKDIESDQAVEDRSHERPSFQSLNDVVEAFLHVPTFRLVFVLGRVSPEVLAEEFSRVTRLRNHVHPLVKAQVSHAEQTALSWQKQQAEGKMEGSSRAEADSALQRVGRGLARLLFGGRPDGRFSGFTWERAPANRSETATRTESTGTGLQQSSGFTLATEKLDSALELVDQSLGRYAENLYAARASGAFRAACFVQGPASASPLLAAAVRGVLSGTHSKDRPMTAFPVQGEAASLLRTNRPTLDLLHPAAPVLTDLQATRMLLLPEAELPGLRLHRGVFLGRNAAPETLPGGGMQPRVDLGRFSFAGADDRAPEVQVELDDLFRHMLVCGTTGSGKTRRVLSILNGLGHLGDEIRVIVFETAKRTYREELCRKGQPSPRIYTLGESTVAPLRINPFFFEPGTSLKRHVSVLADALSELMPTEALIGPKMREAVEAVYLGLGWDIETGHYRGDGDPRYPSPVAFVHAVRRVAEQLTYGREVSANYRGALEGRARVFLDATFQDIFSHDGDRNIEEIFDRDTIIEMEGLPGSEIDLPAFLLSLLVERLRSHQLANKKRRWLLVVEEAHNVLPRSAEVGRGSQEADGAHTLVKNLVRLLQEGREMGIGVVVVDQAPTLLARSVLKNANTKVVMRLEDAEEISEMGQALGLEQEAWPDLGVLRQGEAIIKAPYMAHPVKSAPYLRSALPEKLEPTLPAPPPAPAYPALEEAWAAVLAGSGPSPDASWVRQALQLAGGTEAAVRFGLGRALLRPWTGRAEARTRALLDGYDRLPLGLDELLAEARRWHARARSERVAHELGPVLQRVVAALSDAPCPRTGCSSEAVALSAELLGTRRGGPDAEAWSEQLGALSLARPHRWKPSAARFRAFCTGDAPMGPAIRLLAMAERLGEGPVLRAAQASPLRPMAVMEAALSVVEAQLGLQIPDDGQTLDRLAEGLARVMVHGIDPAAVARLPRLLIEEV